jgi:hypothetical protein
MSFNKDSGELTVNKGLMDIAKLIVEMSFGKDNDNKELYLENAVKMVTNDVKYLREMEEKHKEDKDEPEVVKVNNPENGGWIKAFYNFDKQNPDNKDDVLFIYEFKRGNKVEKLVRKEDIIGWANKWLEFKDHPSKLKLLMGEECWNGKRIDKEGYTTHFVRFALFRPPCANKGKGIEGCYGNVYMDEKLFTRTKNDSGLCKHCEYLDRKISTKRDRHVKFCKLDNSKKYEDSLFDIAEKTALFVLDD